MKISVKKILSLSALALAGLGLSTSTASAAFGTITNDVWKKTTTGTTIFAHAGHISKFGDTYYWYGEKYNGSVTYVNTGTVNSDTSFVCVNCYRSTDLINWTPGVSVLKPGGNIATSDFLGRVAGVFRNSAGKYVMWVRYVGAKGNGELCATADSPTGPFVWDHLQTVIPNVFDGKNGDASTFIDTAHGGTPYFICADGHGRQHAYICGFSSDLKTITAATLIKVWPSGQEGNSLVFAKETGLYYYVTSETNGYSYSQAFQVHSKSLKSGYSDDADFTGTVSTHSYFSQVQQWVTIEGTSGTVYLLMCDRWADLNKNYKNAGHGIGFNVWQPITPTSSGLTFPNKVSWQLDAAAGLWK